MSHFSGSITKPLQSVPDWVPTTKTGKRWAQAGDAKGHPKPMLIEASKGFCLEDPFLLNLNTRNPFVSAPGLFKESLNTFFSLCYNGSNVFFHSSLTL